MGKKAVTIRFGYVAVPHELIAEAMPSAYVLCCPVFAFEEHGSLLRPQTAAAAQRDRARRYGQIVATLGEEYVLFCKDHMLAVGVQDDVQQKKVRATVQDRMKAMAMFADMPFIEMSKRESEACAQQLFPAPPKEHHMCTYTGTPLPPPSVR